MKFVSTLPALTAILLIAFSTSNTAMANPFSDLKKKLKNKTTTSSKKLAKQAPNGKELESKDSVSLTKPSARLTSMTQCSDIALDNIIIGSLGNYTFQQGFSKEERSGLVDRKTGKANNGCILPSLMPRQVAYMEVDTKSFDAMGSSNDWQMQCLRSDNPGAGAVTESEPRTEFPYHVGVLSGKDVMLHCGNSEGVKNCAEGSNSSRSSEWKKDLDSRGKTMLSVMAITSTLAPSSGEKIYCQYYNKRSSKSLFAFEYLRTQS